MRFILMFATMLVALPLLSGPLGKTVGAQSQPNTLDTATAENTIFLPLVNRTQQQQAVTGNGLWISKEEIMTLPTTGAAWQHILNQAGKSTNNPDISDQDDQTDATVVAKALVYVRTGEQSYRNEVLSAIEAAMGTEDGGRTLALGRNLPGYVVAADLVGLDGSLDAEFRSWLSDVRHEELDGRTLITTHEERPNNWGTHAGAARIAATLYLGDQADLERSASVFKGWVGDRSAYDGFEYYQDMSWHCDPSKPVPVNPAGCTIDGHPADGILPDDQRRGGSFSWPPTKENYVWEALQGAVAQAWMLYRAGYPAFEWQDQALLRAVTWLHNEANFPAEGDDTGTPWIINEMYNSNFPTSSPAQPGKNGLGYYDWFTAN